ncbi:MAG: HEAT repeat domain-containing protein, partial [Pyrinomonadaceae bacterium]
MSTNTIDDLLAQLSDSDWEVRQKAADMLAILGPVAKEALVRLRDHFLSDGDPDVQASIVKAIARIEEDKTALLPELLNYLSNVNAQTRQAAADMLADLGPPARPALTSLWNRMFTDEDDVLNSIARAIAAIEDDKTGLIAKCLEYLREGNPKKSQAAAIVLGALKPTDVEETKALETLWSVIALDDDNSGLKTLAFKAIVEVSSDRPAALISLIEKPHISPSTKGHLILLPEVRTIL